MGQDFNTVACLRDVDFKDDSPINTVNRIKEILGKYNIETEETWMESSVPYCYSIRVSVAGTTFGANGKGVTKDFALASGYGELMERLQLGYISKGNLQKDDGVSVNDVHQETISAQSLLNKNRKWYEAFSHELSVYTGQICSPEEILLQYADKDGNIAATPYYCITRNTKEYLPTALRRTIYTTNGCAAGNTMEEAVVQALSEVVERHHKFQILSESITPPDVPETVLEKCEVAYRIIAFLRNNGFKVVIKDCSLGMKFPAVCACIIDLNTGRYHTHFGAYPIFEIALERVLTESFQGRNIRNIAQFENFCYQKNDVFDLKNVINELVVGVAEKLPCFFVGDPRYPYNEDVGFKGSNNRELFNECLEYFQEQGYDVLVRDCSCLGFPTYQVLVPGYSEIFCHRFSPKHNDLRYRTCAVNALRNPSAAKREDLIGLLMHTSVTSRLNNGVGVHGFADVTKLPVKLSAEKDRYFLAASFAYACYALGKYADAVKYIDRMIGTNEAENKNYLLCIKRYLSLLVNGYEKQEIRAVLEFFHGMKAAQLLYACLENGKNPLEEFTLRCDKRCIPDCCLYTSCCQRRVDELTRLIVEKTTDLDFKELENRLTGK